MKLHVLVATALVICSCSSPDEPSVERDLGGQPDTRTVTDARVDDASAADGGGADSGPAADMGGSDLGVDAGRDAGPGPSIDYETYCDDWAKAYVTWLAQCYGSESYDPTDAATLERFAASCQATAPSVLAGRLAYDGEQAVRCLDVLEMKNCDRFDFFDAPECEGIVIPQQAAGDACYRGVTNECLDGWCGEETCPGMCQPFRAIGATCTDTVECDPDVSFCNFESGNCQQLGAVGESCVGVRCENGLECRDEACFQPKKFGDSCTVGGDECEFRTFCPDGTCITKVPTGGACITYLQCPTGETCLNPSPGGGSFGTCSPRGTTGDPCYGEFRDCAAGFYCESASCAPLPSAGMPCLNQRCGLGLWCRHEAIGDDGVCQADGAEGEDCGHGYDAADREIGCSSGLACVDDVCIAPGAAGDPCSLSLTATCQSGLFCSRTTSQCTPTAAAGQPCNPAWANTCAAGLGCDCAQEDDTCDSWSPTNPGDTCAALLDEGQPCWRDVECVSTACFDDGSGAKTCGAAVCLP